LVAVVGALYALIGIRLRSDKNGASKFKKPVMGIGAGFFLLGMLMYAYAAAATNSP
jgi:hypothetical protein